MYKRGCSRCTLLMNKIRNKMNIKPMFSGKRSNWRTPEKLYRELDEEVHFNFDPCPIDPKVDGLKISWKDRNFVNPPYGREIRKWLEKGYLESCKGKLVVFLIPSRTDTIWWHKFVMMADEIRFIKGRLKFSEYHDSAPFPSCIVIFNGNVVIRRKE